MSAMLVRCQGTVDKCVCNVRGRFFFLQVSLLETRGWHKMHWGQVCMCHMSCSFNARKVNQATKMSVLTRNP